VCYFYMTFSNTTCTPQHLGWSPVPMAPGLAEEILQSTCPYRVSASHVLETTQPRQLGEIRTEIPHLKGTRLSYYIPQSLTSYAVFEGTVEI
jgi:hypothetical protein